MRPSRPLAILHKLCAPTKRLDKIECDQDEQADNQGIKQRKQDFERSSATALQARVPR